LKVKDYILAVQNVVPGMQSPDASDYVPGVAIQDVENFVFVLRRVAASRSERQIASKVREFKSVLHVLLSRLCGYILNANDEPTTCVEVQWRG